LDSLAVVDRDETRFIHPDVVLLPLWVTDIDVGHVVVAHEACRHGRVLVYRFHVRLALPIPPAGIAAPHILVERPPDYRRYPGEGGYPPEVRIIPTLGFDHSLDVWERPRKAMPLASPG